MSMIVEMLSLRVYTCNSATLLACDCSSMDMSATQNCRSRSLADSSASSASPPSPRGSRGFGDAADLAEVTSSTATGSSSSFSSSVWQAAVDLESEELQTDELPKTSLKQDQSLSSYYTQVDQSRLPHVAIRSMAKIFSSLTCTKSLGRVPETASAGQAGSCVRTDRRSHCSEILNLSSTCSGEVPLR